MTTCADHTPQPESYLQWHAWAQRMSATHRQLRCADCGLWLVWVAKKLPHPGRAAPI